MLQLRCSGSLGLPRLGGGSVAISLPSFTHIWHLNVCCMISASFAFFRPEHFLTWHHSIHALHNMEACVFRFITSLQTVHLNVLNIFFLFFSSFLSSLFPSSFFSSSSPLTLSISLFLSLSFSLVIFSLASSLSLFA